MDFMVPYHMPARHQLKLKTNNIAILADIRKEKRENDLAKILSSHIEARFIKGNVYRPVDLSSQEFRKKMIEMNLNESTGLNDEQLLQIGKELNVSLLLTPTLSMNYEKTTQNEQRTIKVGTGQYRYVMINGKKVRHEIKRDQLVTDSYEIKNISLFCQVKLVNVETGEVISTFSENSIPNYNSRIIVGRGTQGHPLGDLLEKMLNNTPTVHKPEEPFIEKFIEKVAKRSVNEISPVSFEHAVKIYDDGYLEKGFKFAELNQWQKAADEWEIILADDVEDDKCLVNLGAAYLALGDWEKSSEYLQQAYVLNGCDDALALSQHVSHLIDEINRGK